MSSVDDTSSEHQPGPESTRSAVHPGRELVITMLFAVIWGTMAEMTASLGVPAFVAIMTWACVVPVRLLLLLIPKGTVSAQLRARRARRQSS